MNSQLNTKQFPTWGMFPPYGFMNEDDVKKAGLKAPAGWRGDPESYARWFSQVLRTIQELLWPVFDQNTLAWNGGAVCNMMPLTRLDLDILTSLYSGGTDILDCKVTDNSPVDDGTHRFLFREEDRGDDWSYYFVKPYGLRDDGSLGGGAPPPGFDKNAFENCLDTIKATLREKVAGVHSMKQKLMRPRPYQMAMLLGYQNFSNIMATSATTPSMCSGHCLQGLVAVGAAMEVMLTRNLSLSNDIWAALEQFAVDIGDRRVMARVHYPSDSLCSWFMVITMAEHIFTRPEIKTHLWNAISTRSKVYQRIDAQGPNSRYAPFLRELQRAAK